MGAVSKEVRIEVIRHLKECQASGPHAGHLECSHINHIKDDDVRKEMGLPPYNSQEAVTLLCSRHHLEQHIKDAGKNGLTKSENDWAIRQISKRIKVTELQDEPIDRYYIV